MKNDFESIWGFEGYVPPIVIWTAQNFRELVGRATELAALLSEFEGSAGKWALAR